MAAKKGSLSISSENIFPIIKKWVYSEHDIFVREMVSNGCDAITKLKKLDMMGEYQLPDGYKPSIKIENGVITEMDGKCRADFDMLDTFIADHAIRLGNAEKAMAMDSLEIARKIGLPEDIIRIAGEKAGSDHINIEKQLREIARDKHYWEQKRDRIRLTDRKVEELEQTYAEQLAKIKSERQEILKKAKQEAQRLIADKAYLTDLLRQGAEKAGYVANKTLRKVYKKIGFLQL